MIEAVKCDVAPMRIRYRVTGASMVIIPSICKCAEIQHVRIRFGRWGDCVGVTRTIRRPAGRLMD